MAFEALNSKTIYLTLGPRGRPVGLCGRHEHWVYSATQSIAVFLDKPMYVAQEAALRSAR